MRPPVLIASLALLALASYGVLTLGPFGAPAAEPAPQAGDAVVASPTADGAEVRGRRAERPAAPAGPAVRTLLTTETYAGGGGTADDVLRSMLDGGPRTAGRTFFGLTETAVDLRYDTATAGVGCVVENVEVVLTLTITLPEWTPAADADAGLVRDWARFRRALAAHEDQHREIAERGAASLHQAVDGLRRTTCAQANAEARARLDRLEAAIAEAHARFDAETGHGRTEGAVWPVEGG